MKNLLFRFMGLVFILTQISCSTSRSKVPSRIGITPLQHYSLADNNNVQDTTYKVFRTDEEFTKTFITFSTGAKKPGFSGQIAVAILSKNPSSLRFQRAEHSGPRINIYAQSCTTAQPNCITGTVFLATVPKVSNAKSVQFFIDSGVKSIVEL